jgi:copper homeostasis protein
LTLLEVCVGDATSFAAAIEGGADRIELCSALELGGLTPSPGLMALAANSPVPVYVMVRQRAGDFVFGGNDLDTMLADIDAVRGAGLAGVVLGASRADGRLDVTMLERLIRHADGLGTTLHRAFDLVPDFAEAIETAIELGFERILTSGGMATALEGSDNIAAAYEAARGRIGIMAGAGLSPGNVRDLLSVVPVAEVHSTCAAAVPVSDAAVRLGFASGVRRQTDAEIVAEFKRALASAT